MSLPEDQLRALELMDHEDLLKIVRNMMTGGIVLNFHGKRAAQEVDRKVRPRQTQVISRLSMGTPEDQARNLIIEGENLQAMVTLYKERGQVDLILTDPPYNTGQHFRYNDRWDVDPNDPELGQLVKMEDGSRHTKWMKMMVPRLQMMKAMLRQSGVIAICIDDNELFHLGMMMDEVFGENNRIAIINWQKTTPKNDAKHVSITTEYVLVYAKDIDSAKTSLLARGTKSNAGFFNPDNDSLGRWKQSDLTAATVSVTNSYAIQSPFTGEFHYPGMRHWSNKKSTMKQWLEGWGVLYEEHSLGDGRAKALAIKGWSKTHAPESQALLIETARNDAQKVLERGNWPILYWGLDGLQKPVKKTHELSVKAGAVPVSFWVEEGEVPIQLDSISWVASQSGRSRDGIEELSAIVGNDHGFETVKPLRLFRKIMQIWCPANGLVLDPFAGSGTAGHAVLELNYETGSQRRFILIEQGTPEKGDKYARSLTQERIRRVITGERPNAEGVLEVSETPLGGGFQFRMLTKRINSKAVLSMRKEELIDVVITSHWENEKRGGIGLIRIDDPRYKYLVGRNEQNEGYFLIWNGGEKVGQLDMETYATVVQEANRANLKQPYHVYARYEIYQSRNVLFYKIPDKILAHLGLNESSDTFNEEEGEE